MRPRTAIGIYALLSVSACAGDTGTVPMPAGAIAGAAPELDAGDPPPAGAPGGGQPPVAAAGGVSGSPGGAPGGLSGASAGGGGAAGNPGVSVGAGGGTSPAGSPGASGGPATAGLGGESGAGGAVAVAGGGAAGEIGFVGTGTFAGVATYLAGRCATSTACHGTGAREVVLRGDALYRTLLEGTVEKCSGQPMVVPGDPAGSAIYNVLAGGCGTFLMPPQCRPGPCGTLADRQMIETWIASGAPEN